MKNIVYTGRTAGENNIVLILEDGRGTALPLEPSLAIRKHSPTGFAWGYGGSGPSQLALALILHAVGNCELEERNLKPMTAPQVAERYYQMFKNDFVSQWGDSWKISQAEILGWLRQVEAQAETKRKDYSHSPEFPPGLQPQSGAGTTIIQG